MEQYLQIFPFTDGSLFSLGSFLVFLFKNAQRMVVFSPSSRPGVDKRFCKGPDTNYFKLCGPHMASVTNSSLLLFDLSNGVLHLKNINTSISSWAIQSQWLDLAHLSYFAEPWPRSSSMTHPMWSLACVPDNMAHKSTQRWVERSCIWQPLLFNRVPFMTSLSLPLPIYLSILYLSLIFTNYLSVGTLITFSSPPILIIHCASASSSLG